MCIDYIENLHDGTDVMKSFPKPVKEFRDILKYMRI